MPIKRAETLLEYKLNYDKSIQDPESFWFEEGKCLDWIRPYSRAKDTSYENGAFHIRWYEDGFLNASANCLDRHLPTKANQTAIIWEGDNPEESRKITYQELYEETCKFANVLKSLGIARGDRVIIYLPMIPEIAVALLACARIGAIHSVVFGGFSAESLTNRIDDSGAKLIITSNVALRGGKQLQFKKNVDNAIALSKGQTVKSVIVFKRQEADVEMIANRDYDYTTLMNKVSKDCPPEAMNAEDPLFILYTSGSTGKPKGVVHTTGGYLVYASMTFSHVFGYNPGDIYWCTADVGWVTGHSYIIYGPLACGATTLMFEGIPTYPTGERFWQVIDKHKVNIFYTAPTALRSLMREGEEALASTKRDSLKLLGSVGEPIDPTSWQWYFDKVGHGRCPIMDTWWQTETGGILISPLPITPLKPGSATLPFYGVEPSIIDDINTSNAEMVTSSGGSLIIKNSWPGMARSLYNAQDRFIDTYFRKYRNSYFTGDGAHVDEDGYYWITGRIDDVINVSGHRIGTAEIESVIKMHTEVVESAVVGFPHQIKGQGIFAFIVLNDDADSNKILKELTDLVRSVIGPVAAIDKLQITPSLPKTRSGKVMRRILRKVAAHDFDDFGDTSTLLDPTVVDQLIKTRKKLEE